MYLKLKATQDMLEQERANAEIKIKSGANSFKKIKMHKIHQLYRLAEFGRISSGIFHDLINPLTAVSLNLEHIKNCSAVKIDGVKDAINQALYASQRMEDLIDCIKHAIKNEGVNSTFSIPAEINASLKLLNFKIRKANIKIKFQPDSDLKHLGDAVKFGQIITNLVCNAIDSLATSWRKEKIITIDYQEENKMAIITISDNGPGVKTEYMNKIFEPFFTTKNSCGLGLGLSSVKNITENCFQGTIEVDSKSNNHTTFKLTLPLMM